MKRMIYTTIAFGTILLLAVWLLSRSEHEWTGVDESVVERIAVDAGRPPRTPFIDTDKGDLLLFLFLIAGLLGGGIAGYSFRHLFPPEKSSDGITRKKSPGSLNAGSVHD